MARLSIKVLTACLTVVVCTSCSTIAQETANFFLEDNSATINGGKKKNTTKSSGKKRKSKDHIEALTKIALSKKKTSKFVKK